MSVPYFSDRIIYKVPSPIECGQELLGLREWRIALEPGTDKAILTSLNGQQVWTGPCFESPWAPDGPTGPSTGVHAFKRRARHFFWNKGWFWGRATWAWGWVAMSGLVEESDLGYCSSVAAIRHLRLGARTLAQFPNRLEICGLVADLEERYRCPVKLGYPEWRVSRTMVVPGAR